MALDPLKASTIDPFQATTTAPASANTRPNGSHLGITRERARQIQARAEEKLQFILHREAPIGYAAGVSTETAEQVDDTA